MHHAVIVAHGQPSDPDPAEDSLARFARGVNAYCNTLTVHSATLAKPHAFETCLDGLPSDTVVYPLFMAKGWFVTSVLPKRVGSRTVSIVDPLGVDPELPDLTAAAIRDQVTRLGWTPQDTRLVIAAHGSGRSSNPAKVATGFAQKLAPLVMLNSITVGFVEQPPSIAEAAAGTGAHALCLPFFACTGGHVLEDIPQELERASFKGHVMPVVGELPDVQRHIASRLESAISRSNAASCSPSGS